MIADRWGVTAAEVARHYPCDDVVLIRRCRSGVASPSRRRPIACGRGSARLRLAPYSYDWFDNLRSSLARELRDIPPPAVGQHFSTAWTRPMGRIVSLTPGEQLTGRIPGALLSYLLVPSGQDTRLLLKIVTTGGGWSLPLLSVGDLVMARRQLLNFKRLAEQTAQVS